MAERISPPTFDVDDSKVEIDLGSYIASQVKESQEDLKHFMTLNFERLGKDVDEQMKSMKSMRNDIDELKNSIWWIKPMTGLLGVIATAVVGYIVEQLMSKGWPFHR